MVFVCPDCFGSDTLKIVRSIQLPPDCRSDDIALQVVACDRCGLAALAVYEESRRGSLDSESWSHTGHKVDEPALRFVAAAIAACPRPDDPGCTCAAHQALGRSGKGGACQEPAGVRWGESFSLRVAPAAGSPADERRLYGDLAWTWPLISARQNHVHEAETFLSVLRQHARVEVGTLLHLGCGGGHLDFSLKQHVAVAGVDVSAAMLGLARTLNPEVTYHQADMRAVRLGQTFGAVIAADSIDYMLSEDDLLAAFQTAYAHLVPGGAFSTYAERLPGSFRQNETRTSLRGGGDVEIVLVENWYDPDPADNTYENVMVYLIRDHGRLRIETDRHLGGLFPADTWTRLLREVGFDVRVLSFDDGGPSMPLFVGVRP